MKIHLKALLLIAVAASGCSGSETSPSSTTTTTTTATLTNEVFTGTVAVPVDGIRQSSFNTFVVSSSGYGLTITLTSAVETLPGGTLLTTVTMGLGVGTVTDGVCTLVSGGFTTAQGGSSPQLSGSSAAAGTYCVQVSDVTNQLGPVAYAAAVAHY